MKRLQHNTRIEAYILGHLDAEEKKLLEEEAEKDPSLKKQIYQYKLEYRAMEMLYEDELRKSMESWDKKTSGKTIPLAHSISKVNRLILSAAAIMIILIVGLWSLVALESDLTNSQLARLYAPEIAYQVRGGSDVFSPSKGILLLKDSAFEEAVIFFDSSLTYAPSNEEIQIYLAESLFWDGLTSKDQSKLEKALNFNERLKASVDSKYIREKAEWYSALLMLALDKPQANSHIKSIANDSKHLYRQKAANVLKYSK